MAFWWVWDVLMQEWLVVPAFLGVRAVVGGWTVVLAESRPLKPPVQ